MLSYVLCSEFMLLRLEDLKEKRMMKCNYVMQRYLFRGKKYISNVNLCKIVYFENKWFYFILNFPKIGSMEVKGKKSLKVIICYSG